jgi:hypothetical protein
MSSKVDQLEKQQDQETELSNYKKSKGSYETGRQNRAVKITDNPTMDVVMSESNKPRREIHIEIDTIQRTAVFSSDFAMWI